MVLKTCNDCKKDKPKTEFLKHWSGVRQRERLSPYCHPCRANRQRSNWLRSKYGITLERYQEMLQTQEHRCAICGDGPNSGKKTLCVDHDHSTGRVRGLLCIRCNALIGNALENSEILRSADIYLKMAIRPTLGSTDLKRGGTDA